MARTLVGLAALLLAAPVMAQIYKCPDASGRTVIQQVPCLGGQQMDVRPASGRGSTSAPTTAPAPAPAAPPVAAAPAAAAAPPTPPAAPPVKDALTRDADTCFAWYRPDLLDPRGAYYTEPARDKRVVSLTLHATNRMGGVVTKRVACEIVNGKLDEDWTKIHAERVKW